MPYLRRASLTQSLPQMNTLAMQLYVAVKTSNHTADLSHHPQRSVEQQFHKAGKTSVLLFTSATC